MVAFLQNNSSIVTTLSINPRLCLLLHIAIFQANHFKIDPAFEKSPHQIGFAYPPPSNDGDEFRFFLMPAPYPGWLILLTVLS